MKKEFRETTLRVLHFISAAVGGFALMRLLGYVFDQNNWPVFHSWGLAHGSFFVAWPALGWLVYRLLRYLLGLRC